MNNFLVPDPLQQRLTMTRCPPSTDALAALLPRKQGGRPRFRRPRPRFRWTGGGAHPLQIEMKLQLRQRQRRQSSNVLFLFLSTLLSKNPIEGWLLSYLKNSDTNESVYPTGGLKFIEYRNMQTKLDSY